MNTSIQLREKKLLHNIYVYVVCKQYLCGILDIAAKMY